MRLSRKPEEVLDWLDAEQIQYTVSEGRGTEVNLMVKDQSRMGQVLALARTNFVKTNQGWNRNFQDSN